MALTSGAHVACGFVVDKAGAKLFFPVWSETIAIGGTTSQSAPAETGGRGDSGGLVFRIRAQSAGDIYVCAAATPNAGVAVSTGPNNVRQHMIAAQEKDIPAEVGWKCQVVAA